MRPCLSLTFHCLSTTVSLPFHCLFAAFRCDYISETKRRRQAVDWSACGALPHSPLHTVSGVMGS